MKKFKKLLLTVILLAVCACCTIPFTACGGGWQEVQSITYKTEEGSKTFTSKFYWDVTVEIIEQTDYDSAPEELKSYSNSSYGFPPERTIDTDRNEFLEIANNAIGKTYYYSFYTGPYKYLKITYNSYTLNYVKVKFNGNNSIEINYDGETTKVLPISYEITYFEN